MNRGIAKQPLLVQRPDSEHDNALILAKVLQDGMRTPTRHKHTESRGSASEN